MTPRSATNGLVLSLFPGIGLFDMAFEEEGFCVVRGPDLLWGGDIRSFHPPAGVFAGVIGGPPCQAFSQFGRLGDHIGKIGDMAPEFDRCITEAQPAWFVMENVTAANPPEPDGYGVSWEDIRDHWVGGETRRLRRFWLGIRDGVSKLSIETLALHTSEPHPSVTARAGAPDIGKTYLHQLGYRTASEWPKAVRRQGLPEGFDLPPFKITEKFAAIGNGVPIPMGRAIAKAVKTALTRQSENRQTTQGDHQ